MRLIGLVFTVLIYNTATAQENSPYSRYGLGDLAPNRSIVTRAMGGIAAGYADYQSINFANPASYSNLTNTIFDIGAEADVRTLKSISPAQKFTAANSLFSYLQLGLPIRMKKANARNIFLGVNIGLKPVSQINYKILKSERIPGGDSLQTLYEGTGGLSQAYTGLGLRIKGLSLGFNVGYMFGNKDYSTKLSFINDSVYYYKSNSYSNTNFGSVFFNAGLQYEFIFSDSAGKKSPSALRLGVYGNLKQDLRATRDMATETIVYDASGNFYRIDSIKEEKGTKGTIVYPATIGFGATYRKDHLLVGADFEMTNWKDYHFFGQSDNVQNSWKVRAGAEYFPAKFNTPIKKYFNFVRYRVGFYYGQDYIKVTNNLPEYAFTFGAGFPLKLRRSYYEYQTSILNTAIEIGGRGNKSSNLRESILRISVGLSLGDIWFRRAKYD